MKDRKLERKKAMAELIQNDILDSAAAVLLEKGIKGFTMEIVAANAGIAKGTLYLYFKNKQAILNSVIDCCFNPLLGKYKDITNADHDPVLKLKDYAHVTLEHVENNMALLKELKGVLFDTMDQYIGDKGSWYWVTVNYFASALDEAVKAKKMRPMNSEKIAILFLNSIDSLMSHRIFSSVTNTIEEDVKELMDLYTNGLAL